MPKISDQLRAEAVAEYLRGTTTQEEVCVAFEARTGHPLSPRTLRSWIARFSSGGRVDVRTRALLADALDQVRALEARLQAALGQFDGEAAAPMQERHVVASHEGLRPAVAPAGSAAASAGPVGPRWAVAAALPVSTQVVADANELVSTNSFWD